MKIDADFGSFTSNNEIDCEKHPRKNAVDL